MALHLCILGSGSSGNSTYVASESTAILIDAGLSAREIERRLQAIEVSVNRVHAICVSHEHQDHTAGLRVLQSRHGLRLFANAGTIEAIEQDPRQKSLPWSVFSTGTAFAIGDLVVEPFSVPHDAMDPVGFVVTCGEVRVGIVTDMGIPTTLVRERLKRCHALVIESNHDEQLLRDAARPWHLKQRIAGRQGHLSNQRAADMLADLAGPQLSHVFLAHLSEECNREELALKAAQTGLSRSGFDHVKVSVTFPDRVSEMWQC